MEANILLIFLSLSFLLYFLSLSLYLFFYIFFNVAHLFFSFLLLSSPTFSGFVPGVFIGRRLNLIMSVQNDVGFLLLRLYVPSAEANAGVCTALPQSRTGYSYTFQA
jgi:hypothetical protein